MAAERRKQPMNSTEHPADSDQPVRANAGPTGVRHSVLHVGLSVRGAIQWPDRQLRGMVSDENGDRLTPRETRNWLMDQLSQGVEMLSFGGCDNFDPKTGCRGHDPVSPTTGATEPPRPDSSDTDPNGYGGDPT